MSFRTPTCPGSERLKRWEDVQVLLDAGIDVLTTMNIQHLESLNDQIWHITGIRVRETIPDWVMQQADQVVMVDLTPRALLNRLERGVVYSQEKAQKALENFFQESTLVVLREMALRQTAHEVEIRQVDYDAPGLRAGARLSRRSGASRAATADRILILVTPDPSTAMLIRRGKRVADYLHADCFAVAVSRESDLHDLSRSRSRSGGAPPELRAQPAHRNARAARPRCRQNAGGVRAPERRDALVPGPASTEPVAGIIAHEAWCSKWYTWRAICK